MQDTRMIEGLAEGLKWTTEGAPRDHFKTSERVVPPEKVGKNEWPFTAEWQETVRGSEIPVTFPLQEDLFAQAVVRLHPEWVDEKKPAREAVAAYARMLGIPDDSDRETVAYALGLADAVSKTKVALQADDPKTWTRVETSFKGREHVTISYNPPTAEALNAVRTLDKNEDQTNRNPLTHALRLGKPARQYIEENFGGNPVGLTANERITVADQLQRTAVSRSVSRSADFYEEGLSSVQTAVNSVGEQLGTRLEEWLPMARTLEELTIFYTFCAENLTGEEPFVPVLTEKFNGRLVELVKPFTEKSVSPENLLAVHEQGALARGGDKPGYYHAREVAQRDRALDDNP